MIRTENNTVIITGHLENGSIKELKNKLSEISKNDIRPIMDLSEVTSAGTLITAYIARLYLNKQAELITGKWFDPELKKFMSESQYGHTEKKIPALDKIVITVSDFGSEIRDFVILSADIFYYSIRSVFSSYGRRKGSVYEQLFLMGNNAVPIVALLSFLIGLILSLQSAAQLRQFGANIYLVDLIVIGMILEMGPMITAVIVAGRSGSAIAAEISAMKITEELDALKVMALNPLRYVVAPKMLAMTIALPVLTVLSNMVGIFGGFIIGVLYLDLSADIFLNRAVEVVTVSYWRQSMLKSLLFSWLIVLIGSHFGFKVKGGSEEVGKAATASVVASIFAVIMTDALLSLIFYYEW